MADFEELLGKIMGDPAQMENISRMAAQLLGGDSAEEEAPVSRGPDLSGLLGKIIPAARSENSDKAALIAAMAPYLKPSRREKLQKALQISRVARIAGLAFGEEEGHV